MGEAGEGLQGQAGFPELGGILSLEALSNREESEAQLVFVGDQPSGGMAGEPEYSAFCARCTEPRMPGRGVMPGLVIRSRGPAVGSVLA